MSLNQERIRLDHGESLEVRSPVVLPVLRAAITFVGQTATGLLHSMFGHEERNMERWAQTERVKWYEGCGR